MSSGSLATVPKHRHIPMSYLVRPYGRFKLGSGSKGTCRCNTTPKVSTSMCQVRLPVKSKLMGIQPMLVLQLRQISFYE